ncbi:MULTISPECIES: MbtH family NRPS accessory protein [unclassified Streptomyces]|uniref:MbtH family NRPS accessory protein n=1 Tax=unclassified Streptomyces TaxID=2593676 RepID=UPI001F03FD13|nr:MULTISPECIES: MbtH family NRPS accessory protein [unclassified Streptomyces]MCH0564870.1 MbtH family protein [Streptomyces sp. MUM 2J]MCH0569856.1 MbtH family protein [Streptomyces sp. MUM 136J]
MTGNPGSPFDPNDGGAWLVVVDGRGRHALWRPFLDVPAGWRVVLEPTDRASALEYVESHATLLGPAEPGARP